MPTDYIQNLYHEIDLLIDQHISFLITAYQFAFHKKYEIKFCEYFIYEKNEFRVQIGYEPFEMWCDVDSKNPPKEIRKFSMKANSSGARLSNMPNPKSGMDS